MDIEPGWTLRWIRENAARLRDLRNERRVSQRQLADGAGTNVSQVSRTEAGRDVQISTLLRLYDGLGYRIQLELQETSEEVGELLSDESCRRRARRDDGLLNGKRWR